MNCGRGRQQTKTLKHICRHKTEITSVDLNLMWNSRQEIVVTWLYFILGFDKVNISNTIATFIDLSYQWNEKSIYNAIISTIVCKEIKLTMIFNSKANNNSKEAYQ